MAAIPVTIFFSLLLAGAFVALFAREQCRRTGSAERDSLLPLADEQPRVADPKPAHRDDPGSDHHHGHEADGPCGCRSGLRPPCTGCLKRAPANRLL